MGRFFFGTDSIESGFIAGFALMPEEQKYCRNCKTPLRGEFCSKCGQREGRGDVHLSEIAGDLADDFFHWDSRIWRTLFPLLFRPGFLTAEFIAGRKARYVPAFRLYLIISFALFLALSFNSVNVSIGGPVQISDRGPVAESKESSQGTVAPEQEDNSMYFTFDFRPGSPEDQAAAEKEGDTVTAPSAIGDDDTVALDQKITIGLADEDSPQWLKKLDQRLDDKAGRLSENPGEFLSALMEYLPQTMFVLLPLFALLLRLCYLSSPFHYLQHLVFALHFHSFLYLLVLFGSLAGWVLVNVDGLLSLLLLLYLPLALRRAYGSSVGGAVAKSLFIVLVDAVMLVFGFAAAAIVALVLM